jgi:multiple antibiotic resistance protein
MLQLWTDFVACFIPLFIAVDVIGILPTFIGITSDSSIIARRAIVWQASLTAIAVGVLFVVLGKTLFGFLGIGIPDFQVAGGILLFLFAVRDLSDTNKDRRSIPDAHIGIVPIGMPLIVGPGVLTTLLLMEARYGIYLAVAALLANVVIVYFTFRYSDLVLKVIGKPGAIAIGKIFSIFLGAIGVMLIRKGVFTIIDMMQTP